MQSTSKNIKNGNVSSALKKMLEDKKAIHKYFQEGKKKDILDARGIKFAMPL